MAYFPLPALDNLNVREWNELTLTNDKEIDFCQHVYPTELCLKKAQ